MCPDLVGMQYSSGCTDAAKAFVESSGELPQGSHNILKRVHIRVWQAANSQLIMERGERVSHIYVLEAWTSMQAGQ